MTRPKFRISKRAIEDLENIWHYTSNKWSVEQADRYYRLIIEEIQNISTNQVIWVSADHIRKGYFKAKVNSHLIFYRKTNDIVEVIRILHQRMDIENRLSD